MHITAPVEIAEQIRECLRRGEYATESDVVIDRFSDHEAVNLSPDELDEAFCLERRRWTRWSDILRVRVLTNRFGHDSMLIVRPRRISAA